MSGPRADGPDRARTRILERIRAANRERRSVAHPGPLPGEWGAPAPSDEGPGAVEARVAAFRRRLEASGGEVVVLSGPQEAKRWLEDFALGFGSVAPSPDLEESFRPSLEVVSPERADLGVSVALGAAAQTGSLLLGSREGRRLQLLPPVHLVWVHASDVHSTLDGALEAVRDELPAVVALHSGPSKSADIGRIVVTGVHGPGRLVAAVWGADLEPSVRPSARSG